MQPHRFRRYYQMGIMQGDVHGGSEAHKLIGVAVRESLKPDPDLPPESARSHPAYIPSSFSMGLQHLFLRTKRFPSTSVILMMEREWVHDPGVKPLLSLCSSGFLQCYSWKTARTFLPAGTSRYPSGP